MGYFADATATKFNFTREQQDAFASQSMTRALHAQEQGLFNQEIAPVTVSGRKGDTIVQADEAPDASKLAKISQLKPAFRPDGTVTAANSSSIADGAASLILMTSAKATQLGLKPLAKIIAHASHAQEPEWFTTAPVEAIRSLLTKAKWTTDDVDLYEINEAFAVVTMAAISELELNADKVNIHGGACALGHPIGASGARILVTLIYALIHQQKTRGVAALCIGGGEATAMAIEIIHG
jgi:acetyl-CoA C-acetyltransferase